jgi:hypothetical protein
MIKYTDIKYSKVSKNFDHIFKGLSLEDLQKRFRKVKINEKEEIKRLNKKNSDILSNL